MKLAKDIGLILFLAFIWFAPAYYAAEALLPSWGLQCGLASLIMGLMGLAVVNRSEAGRRLFYNGEADDDEIGCIKIIVWFLLGVPVAMLLAGTLWWIARLLGLFGPR